MTKIEAIIKAKQLANETSEIHTLWIVGPGLYDVTKHTEGDHNRQGFYNIIRPEGVRYS